MGSDCSVRYPLIAGLIVHLALVFKTINQANGLSGHDVFLFLVTALWYSVYNSSAATQ